MIERFLENRKSVILLRQKGSDIPIKLSRKDEQGYKQSFKKKAPQRSNLRQKPYELFMSPKRDESRNKAAILPFVVHEHPHHENLSKIIQTNMKSSQGDIVVPYLQYLVNFNLYLVSKVNH